MSSNKPLSSQATSGTVEEDEPRSSAQVREQIQLLNNERHQLQSKIEDLAAKEREHQKQLKEIERKLLHAWDVISSLRKQLREKNNLFYALIKLSRPLHRVVGYPVSAFLRRKDSIHRPTTNTDPSQPMTAAIDGSIVLSLLMNSIDPVFTLNRLLLGGNVSIEVLSHAIEMLFNDRTGTLLRMSNAPTEASSPLLAMLIKLYSHDFQGLVLRPEEIDEAVSILYNEPYIPSYTTEAVLLRCAIKSQSMAYVSMVIEKLRIYQKRRLPGYSKIGILRLAAQNPDDYRKWRERMDLSPLESIQIVELDVQVGLIERTSHRDVERALEAVAGEVVTKDLQREVVPFFDRFKDQCRWLDVRVDAVQRAEFVDMIRQYIAEKKSFSLIRLGDGESYAWRSAVSDDRASIREQMWWGGALPSQLRHQISAEILEAIEKADVLGVPSIFRIARDLNPSVQSLFGEPSRRELLIVLQGVSELPPSSRTFTEERVHQVCFELPRILELAQQAQKVVVVSSIVPHAIMKCFLPIADRIPIETILVTTHTKTSQNSLFIHTEEKLPYTYKRVVSQIDAVVEPGTLVLVASGSIGKIFCHAAQRAGGVALDIGAMADYWIGVKTRSIADMV